MPKPTDWFGVTIRSMESPFVKLWIVEIETCVFIFFAFAVISLNLVVNAYSKLLLVLTLVAGKNRPPVEVVSPTWVTIPIKSFPLLIT